LADGFSMAIGKYSSDSAELERIAHIRQMEEESILLNPKEERSEIATILKHWGFKGRDLTRAQEILTSNPKIWVKMMLNHEFNIIEENVDPVKGATITFAAFLVIGLIPLLGYASQSLTGLGEDQLFMGTAAATLFALFIVGTVKSRFSSRHWIVTGTQTALIGGLAAGISYVVGVLLGNLFNIR